MADILATLTSLSAFIEKGGVIGVLILVICAEAYGLSLGRKAYLELRAELVKTYASRDKYRLGYVVCKTACDAAGLKPDLSALHDLQEDVT